MTAQHPPVPPHRDVPLNVTAAGELELGERYTEPPKPLVWTGDGRPCTICRQPAMWRRPTSIRGAAVHPECETGFFDEVSSSVLADIASSLVTVLGATGCTEGWHEPAPVPPESRRLGRADAGCELCRRPLRRVLDRRRSLALRSARHHPLPAETEVLAPVSTVEMDTDELCELIDRMTRLARRSTALRQLIYDDQRRASLAAIQGGYASIQHQLERLITAEARR